MHNWAFAAALALQGTLPAPPAASSIPPTPEQVLAVPEDLRADLNKYLAGKRNTQQDRLRYLVEFMISPDGLNVQYQADATHTVAETFQTRKANCLAFTLLTIALAREINLPAYGRQIDRVLSWDLSGQYVIQNTHANAGVIVDDKHFVIDIATGQSLAASLPRRVEDDRLFTMFYNNHAMELMVDGQLSAARVWLDKAMQYDDGDASLWSNAGVLELRTGDKTGAERMFLEALGRDRRNPAALSNLVALYARDGQPARAATWQKRADRLLRNDPFYQFQIGQERERSGQYQEAIQHYRRAVDLDGGVHIFHFGLARAYFHTGQLAQANAELALAEQLGDAGNRPRYQAKLDALRHMRQR